MRKDFVDPRRIATLGHVRHPPGGRPRMSPPALPPRYADAAPLGTGGMGEVYVALDVELERRVAIKVLAAHLARDDDARRRFRREGRAAARISHPNVVAVYDVGEWEGRPFLVMEYVPGGSVAESAGSGPVPVPRVLSWVRDAAGALDAAHREGVVHRDVKPANLLLDRAARVKVADFGIARVLEGGGPTLTATGVMVGTVGYLAPEQLRDEPVSPASDVYALAVVAYELLTGDRPFGGRSTAAEISAQLMDPPPPPSGRIPGLAAVDRLFARSLATDPAERPATAGGFADELERGLRGVVSTAAPTVTSSDGAPTVRAVPPGAGAGPPPPRRGRLRAVSVAAAAVVAAAAIAGAVILAGDDDDDRGAARSVPVTRRATEAPAAPAVRTVTESAPPRTVTEEVPAGPAADAPARGGVTVGRARELTDEAWGLISDGRPEEALSLMQEALPALAGSGDPYEGNAFYNVGRALLDMGECSEAVPHLESAAAIDGTPTQDAVRRQTLDDARSCA